MGVRYQTQAQGFTYTVVDDLRIVYQALITGALVDEIFGTPLNVNATITADLLGIHVNYADGALFALSGYADRVFPNLATTGYTVNLTISAPGYRPQTIAQPVPAGSTLPVSAGVIKLGPLPVRLQGRVVKLSDRSPIAGATVSSTSKTVLLSRTPLYFDHAFGVAVKAFTFTPSGPSLTLTAVAAGGTNAIFLSSTAGLAPAQVLQIGADPLAELAIVASLGPDPAQVNLQNQLNSTFPANSPVQPVTAAALAGSTSLARSSNAGDGLMIVSPAMVASGVQVLDGTKTEFHLLNAISDADGFYHVNGVGGPVSLDLKAAATGFTAANANYSLVYSDPVNVVDFRLKP